MRFDVRGSEFWFEFWFEAVQPRGARPFYVMRFDQPEQASQAVSVWIMSRSAAFPPSGNIDRPQFRGANQFVGFWRSWSFIRSPSALPRHRRQAAAQLNLLSRFQRVLTGPRRSKKGWN